MAQVLTIANLRTHVLQPLSGQSPKSAVLLLHGLGADGADLISLGAAWGTALPNTLFLAPDAPDGCDMAPFGYQWFSLQDHAPEAILKGVQSAAPVVNKLIDEVLTTYDIAPERLALCGFSQGTIMSLYVAPRRGASLACVLGFSGLLVGGESLVDEKKSSPDTLLIHGTHDDVLPFPALSAAEHGLKAAGIPVRSIACAGLGHGIDETGVREGALFLQKHLAD